MTDARLSSSPMISCLVLAVAMMAGCGEAAVTSPTASAHPATTPKVVDPVPTAPEPPPPTILESLDAPCKTGLATRDGADVAALGNLLEAERRIASMRSDVRAARYGLEAQRNGLSSAEAVAGFNARIDAFNGKIRRLNGLADRAFKASRSLNRLERRRHTFLASCLKRIPLAVWGDAVRATELASERAARSVGRRDPLATCDAPAYAQLTVRDHGKTWDLYGYVFAGSNVIHLSPVECFALEQVRTHAVSVDCVRKRPIYDGACSGAQGDAANALITITHEQQHVDGISSEARAECQAFQLVFRVGPEFGIAKDAARLIGPYVHATVIQPRRYRSTSCAAGKRWDMHLSPGWPQYRSRA